MIDEKTVNVLKIRAKLLDAARCWFNNKDYVEVHGPTTIPAVGEWPNSFEVRYFDKKAYLSQGLQPYDAVFVASLGKVYTIAPTFRAEKLSDHRHLTEYWRIEVAQRCDLNTIIRFEEKLVAHVCHSLSKEPAALFKYTNGIPKDLAKVQPPFPKLTYDQAVDLLQRDGFKVFWGQRIDWELEKHLSQRFKSLFFITKFPLGIETFFHKSDPEKPELTLSADLIAPQGYGEIGSTAQRITEKKILLKKMAEEDIDAADQRWYMNFMQKEASTQSGFIIGVERLVQWICNLQHIKEAAAFPRLHDYIYP